jgi:hypothetical protein
VLVGLGPSWGWGYGYPYYGYGYYPYGYGGAYSYGCSVYPYGNGYGYNNGQIPRRCCGLYETAADPGLRVATAAVTAGYYCGSIDGSGAADEARNRACGKTTITQVNGHHSGRRRVEGAISFR